MKLIAFRLFALVGVLALVLLGYSFIRSPSGTIATLGFIATWWVDPIVGNSRSNDPLKNTGIIENPKRESVAGMSLTEFRITFQSENRFQFNGDGHSIVIAELRDHSGDILKSVSQTRLTWSKLEEGILKTVQFLKDTTPYESARDQIDPILMDPEALYFLADLKRNGADLTNLRIYIVSPSTKKILEWSSDF